MNQLVIQPLGEWRASTASNLNTLGDTVTIGNKSYRYVKYVANSPGITVAEGDFVVLNGTNSTHVTADHSVGGTIGAGVLVGTPTANYYGWVQIAGLATLHLALVSGTTSGSALIPAGGTDDGKLKVASAATDFVVAVTVDEAAKTVFLRCAGTL